MSSTNNENPFSIKVEKFQRLKGGAIVEVTSVEQAKIAETASACCVVVTNPVENGPYPTLIGDIKESVSIPIMAKSRVGHFVEAQILELMDVDYIDENEIIGLADKDNFINKHNFKVPFVCGCRDLGEGLSRVGEGAAMIRIQGDFFGFKGDISETVRNVRKVMGDIRVLNNMDEDEVFAFSRKIEASYDVVAQAKQMGRLPVMHFAAGGIETPADAALMMKLGCNGVFVGQEIFNCSDSGGRIQAIVHAVRNFNDPRILAMISGGASCSIL